MIINEEHYLNNPSRKIFLEMKLSEGILEIARFKELNELLNSKEENTIVLPMGNSKNDIDSVLDRGILFGETNIEMLGEPSQCHSNSAELFRIYSNEDIFPEGSKIEIMNGFALSEDGLWRFHSWILLNNEIVIETTEKRLGYYGFIVGTELKDLDNTEYKNELEAFLDLN